MTQPEYDGLWPGGPRFVRSGAGFALGTDSVLLADFCSLRPGERAIELGCWPILRRSAAHGALPTSAAVRAC